MKFRRRVQMVVGLLGLLSNGLAHAVDYQIDAIRTVGSGALNPFKIVFSDRNGDGVFEYPELVSFTGFSIDVYNPALVWSLVEVPDIPGIASQAGTNVCGSPPSRGVWCVEGYLNGVPTQGASFGPDLFTYVKNVVPVPEPASVLLLALGLGMTGVAIRRGVRKSA